MGFRDKVAQQADGTEAPIEAGSPPSQLSQVTQMSQRFEYDAEVNKKDINMRSYAGKLNARARDGWRLHTAFEQGGNTVSIFERPVY